MLLVPEKTRMRLAAEALTESAAELAVKLRLRLAGLRPTRQRIAIGRLLFGPRHRHVSADDLFQEALAAGEQLSLATIYNTLHHFGDAGLVRRICTGSERVYFDTDTGDHHHFYVEAEHRIIDVPGGKPQVDQLPTPPAGYQISKVDVIIHLKPNKTALTDPNKPARCKNGVCGERSAGASCPSVNPIWQVGAET